ncbi:hypothetical protein [Pseudoalteromonas peptidolytica]|uniref:Uncharacterized protein n=1 Tax=Pseudoalteromonas peptidolytica F12-50-A1 TaxID=1315280 RepID=A0A8I0MZT9_9GAMM|nr:hypothetical protein [Pseudoalteromonas peptidolytica]MBE0348251.1 hypothetical protein [Pseudoalteromonas peptidolytica F12-50-A1]NLR16539.1 hypothetical protein [Pseudoalteromonas peptidolytica]GEK08905.1 hypothetical protein PPE03_11540 [Pseudoalteromonas peptidolytica]
MAKKSWEKLDALDDGAQVQEAKTQVSSSTKSKLINKLPTALEERYEALKAQGKTTLNFSHYIVEALREKLDREE